MDPFEYGPRFLDVLGDSEAEESLFQEWLTELQVRPLWSQSSQEGRRIPWRLAPESIKYIEEVMSHPGCYVFGICPTIFRYIGNTGQNKKKPSTRVLHDRIFGRHLLVRGREGQKKYSKDGLPPISCQLFIAEDYQEAILARARKLLKIDEVDDLFSALALGRFSKNEYDNLVSIVADEAFPKAIREKYLKNHSSLLKFHGAVDYVLHGLDQIWFTLLPFDDRTKIDILEAQLIKLANNHNRAIGYQYLYQEQKYRKYRLHLDGAQLR